ncbi:unnamed protein product [Durusdinium trenchii]|uniref:SH3 domain-containing protein n=1 Tax=Durusdinium trenchii TaxID=1381693 RepID=A0ABP0RX97_9DINO
MAGRLGSLVLLGAATWATWAFCPPLGRRPPLSSRPSRPSRVPRADRLFDSETGVFKAETNIKVRLAADINAPTLAGAESKKLKSGEWVSVIKAGEFFQASELKQKAEDGQTYLKLADQDGWVFGKGIAGEWRGKDIVVPVAEADVINAKAKIVANTMERQLIRDDSDKFALYVTRSGVEDF